MNHKAETLYRGLTLIDDDILEEVEAHATSRKARSRKHTPIARYAALAACLVLVLGAALLLNYLHQPGNAILAVENNQPDSISCYPAQDPKEQPSGTQAEGVTIPNMEVSLDANASACMIPFFIYQGKQFIWLAEVEDPSVLDDYLGTVTGPIDVWTPAEGYVDFAGSVQGEIYSVQGSDPGFLVCLEEDNGNLAYYANSVGITLVTGSDLFRDRFPVQEHYQSLGYQAWDDWYYSQGNIRSLSPGQEDTAQDFLDLLQGGTFILRTGLEELTDLIHVYVHLDSGLTLHFFLYENDTDGYIYLDNFWTAYLIVDKAALEGFVSSLGFSIP